MIGFVRPPLEVSPGIRVKIYRYEWFLHVFLGLPLIQKMLKTLNIRLQFATKLLQLAYFALCFMQVFPHELIQLFISKRDVNVMFSSIQL